MGEPAIKKALEYQNYFMHDEKLRHKYELQEKAIRDYNSSMLAAKEEGIDIGKQQEKYDMAKQMLMDGVDIKFIAKYTKLSIDDIKKLK